ncbi:MULTISPECIES: PD-(D/E)XK nuclease domain-containing protein [Oscillospiraceae]|uniref:PD-(D/E)XK nuclease domain-containing protein n=1 Tax=Oscillospiraceae TaxID=216572 RepID=UPI001FA95109|nr:PD-(D/E)XK nuclease domain-containing protein [Pseudoflavonifractor sp. BSD2780061688st1 E11]
MKTVRQELTYKDIYDSEENIWSVLFTTGYLTRRGRADGNRIRLAILNKEILNIFEEQISRWFQETARKDGAALSAFCEAFENGDAKDAQQKFNEYLNRTISIRDTAVRKEMKENYFHGLLLGLLDYKENWHVTSNRESGDGYTDILIEIDEKKTGIVIEVKYAEDGTLEAGCREALHQINAGRYTDLLPEDGMKTILKYGVACYRKRCQIELERVQY